MRLSRFQSFLQIDLPWEFYGHGQDLQENPTISFAFDRWSQTWIFRYIVTIKTLLKYASNKKTKSGNVEHSYFRRFENLVKVFNSNLPPFQWRHVQNASKIHLGYVEDFSPLKTPGKICLHIIDSKITTQIVFLQNFLFNFSQHQVYSWTHEQKSLTLVRAPIPEINSEPEIDRKWGLYYQKITE